MAKKMKPVPTPPAEAANWSKDQFGHYLLEVLEHSLGAAVRSELLPRQMENCSAGVREVERRIDSVLDDELARQYQQIRDEYVGEAEALLEDYLQVFFVAAQMYVTNVVEALRWFKAHEAGKYNLTSDYSDAGKIRARGKKVVGQMTAAECAWHLGNFAKHNPELEELHAATRAGLTALGAVDGNGQAVGEASTRALETILSGAVRDFADITAAVQTFGRTLHEWAEQLHDEVIGDLDEFRYQDRGRTKRESEAFRSYFAQRRKEKQ